MSWELLPYEGSRSQLGFIGLDQELLGGADVAHSGAIGDGFGQLDGWKPAGGERALGGLGGSPSDAHTTYTNVDVDDTEDPVVARVLRLPKHVPGPISVRAAARLDAASGQSAHSRGGTRLASSWRHRRSSGNGRRLPQPSSRFMADPSTLLMESNRSPQQIAHPLPQELQQPARQRSSVGARRPSVEAAQPLESPPLSASAPADQVTGSGSGSDGSEGTGAQFVQTVSARTTSASIGGLEPFAWYRVRVMAMSRGGAELGAPAVLYLYTGASDNLLVEARAELQRVRQQQETRRAELEAQAALQQQQSTSAARRHRHTTASTPNAHSRRRGSGRAAPASPAPRTGGASSPLYTNQLLHYSFNRRAFSMPVLFSFLTALLLLLCASR